MNDFLFLDASCVINSEGFFLYVNEPFLKLFEVSEQILITEMNITDFISDPELKIQFNNTYDLPFTEFNFNKLDKSIFSSFLAIASIPNTALRVITIKAFSKNLLSKRTVTAFRRYADRQIAIGCFQVKENQFLPLQNINMDLIDDNPAFLIELGSILFNSISMSTKSFTNIMGLLKINKLLDYLNFNVLAYIFQLLVPRSKEIDNVDFITETFALVFFFPSALTSLFSDHNRINNSFKEHISQISNSDELTPLFLEELKQKVALDFDSKNIKNYTELDKHKHNFYVLNNQLHNTPLNQAINILSTYCLDYFGINSLTILQYYFDELKQLNTIGITNFIPEYNNVDPNSDLIDNSIKKNSHFIHEDYFFIPITNKSKLKLFGLLQIESNNVITSDTLVFLASQFGKLLENHEFEEKLLLIQKLTDILLHVPDIKSLFESIAQFLIQAFAHEFKLFVAFIFNSETESLEFLTQRGYPSEFNVKSIALNSRNSVVAKSARDLEILNIGDVSKIDYYLQGLDLVQSELSIPMSYNNQLIGVLNIESNIKEAYSHTFHVPLMKIIRDLAVTTYLRISMIKKIGGSKFNLP